MSGHASEITVFSALRNWIAGKKSLSSIPNYAGGWRRILEPFAGAWQMNVEEKRGDLVSYPTLFACLSRIAADIGKLPFQLKTRQENGIWVTQANPAYDPVLRKPNSYQTSAQFRECWILSKLANGNAYILKERDNRGVVIGLYVLNAEKVMPMVSESGAVFYRLQHDPLNNLPNDYPNENLIVPASEIIHDRCMTVHHPLIGIPPLAAAHWPAVKNLKIMRSATQFFANNASPGGILTAPAGMTEKDAERVREYWNQNFKGDNAGKVAVIGADMKFVSFAMKSIDSQMVEQMRYSDEQICQPFGIPPFKIGIGSLPSGMGVDGMNMLYYADALQTHIEHMETLLDDGLQIKPPLGIELDLEPLLRMDESRRADVATKLVGGGVATPNEARLRFNLDPLAGGDTIFLQQQDIPLEQARLNTVASVRPIVEPADSEQSEGDKATAKALPSFSPAIRYKCGSLVSMKGAAFRAERDAPVGLFPGDPDALGFWRFLGLYDYNRKTIKTVYSDH
jgi:phage portal protein, HK97 family